MHTFMIKLTKLFFWRGWYSNKTHVNLERLNWAYARYTINGEQRENSMRRYHYVLTMIGIVSRSKESDQNDLLYKPTLTRLSALKDILFAKN